MKLNSTLAKKIVAVAALVIMAAWLSMGTAPADQPLSKDDITLLLLGSTPAAKIIQSVEQRGVDFQMDADLAKKFHDQGASDDLINALKKAGEKAGKASAPAPAPSSAPAPAAPASSAPPPAPPAAVQPQPAPDSEPSLRRKANSVDAPEPRAAEAPPSAPATPVAPSAPSTPIAPSDSDSEPVLHTRQSSASSTPAASSPAPAPATPSPATATRSSSEPVLRQAANASSKDAPEETKAISNAPGLKDPDAAGIQHIIQEFAAKEKIFKEARNNYTYHQINKVEELGGENEVKGTYEQEWDILYDDSGKRIEKVTYAPLNTLKSLIVTKEDIEGFRSIQPFVLTSDEVSEYDIAYMGHVNVDKITAYVFRIRPKEIEKNKQYFQGVVWVDDRDLQIVKSEGKQVPQDKVKHGQENLFPRFTTYREQVDGKFWFPTFTMANDTLYFSNAAPVHMKEIVRYTDYKQFKSGARILTVEEINKQKDQNTPAAPTPQK